MFDYLHDKLDDSIKFEKIKEELLQFIEEVEQKEGLEKLPYIDIIGKVSFYKTLFNIYESTKDKNTLNLIINNIQEDKEKLEELIGKTNEKNIEFEKLKNNKHVLITKKNEIIIFTRSEQFWYYIIINTFDDLKVFNLTSLKNGYHIFETGRFCAGTTYRDLKCVLEKGEVVKFILLLKKVLTDFDDGAQHTAVTSDFDFWRELKEELKKGKLTLKNKTKALMIINKKLDYIKKNILKKESGKKLSREAKEFVLDKIDFVENIIRTRKVGD